MESKGLLLASGGIDSTTAMYELNKKISHVLFINYGQICFKNEYGMVRMHSDRLEKTLIVHDISYIYKNFSSPIFTGIINKKPSYDIPGRNLLFLSIANVEATKLGLTKIHTGLFDSMYGDASSEFINSLNEAIHNSGGKVVIENPFQKFKKESIILQGTKLKIDLSGDTFSCYISKYKKHCGRCMACIARDTAFKKAGIEDTTEYELPFD